MSKRSSISNFLKKLTRKSSGATRPSAQPAARRTISAPTNFQHVASGHSPHTLHQQTVEEPVGLETMTLGTPTSNTPPSNTPPPKPPRGVPRRSTRNNARYVPSGANAPRRHTSHSASTHSILTPPAFPPPTTPPPPAGNDPESLAAQQAYMAQWKRNTGQSYRPTPAPRPAHLSLSRNTTRRSNRPSTKPVPAPRPSHTLKRKSGERNNSTRRSSGKRRSGNNSNTRKSGKPPVPPKPPIVKRNAWGNSLQGLTTESHL